VQVASGRGGKAHLDLQQTAARQCTLCSMRSTQAGKYVEQYGVITALLCNVPD
jgi:hypothetical protein